MEMKMCDIHKVRKRPNTCEACRAELEGSKSVNKVIGQQVKVANDSIIQQIEEDVTMDVTEVNVEDSNETLEPPISEQQYRLYDSKAIRVMIEAEITKAVAKVRAEMSDLMRINWEHLYVPYTTFSMQLMSALEKEGWKYCDMIKNARTFGYPVDGDIFLLQRIIKKSNAPTPDFTKANTVKRYLNKNNE
jgi:hypothetical protein